MGRGYLTDAMIQWHMNDSVNRMYCVLPGGKKIAMPRYYKKFVYGDDYSVLSEAISQVMIAQHAEEMSRLKIEEMLKLTNKKVASVEAAKLKIDKQRLTEKL